MLDFDYYDKIKKASIVPEYIRAVYDADDDSDKLLIDMCLPALKVIFYAATHEPRLFSDLMEKMIEAPKLPPYFHREMLYKESFQCFCLLGDECLKCLLSELDCSIQVYNGLHSSIIKDDFDAFVIVMEGWNGSFSKITPICKLLYLEISLIEAVDQIMQRAKNIGEIQDSNQQEREANTLLSNVFNAFLMKVKDVLRNEPEGLYVANKIEEAYNECHELDKQPNINDEIYEAFKEGYQKGVLSANPNAKIEIVEKTPENFFYKMLLSAYDFLATETSISPSAIKAIKEILYTPEYEAIWKQYEDSGSIDFILDEIEPIAITPQIEEPDKEEVKVVPEQSRNTPGQRGRRNGRWIKGRSQIGDEQIGALIQRDIWDSLVKSVNGFTFQDGIAGKTRDAKVRNFSAALLYYILEKIGWARVFSESGVQSSFCKRTMKFAGIPRSSFTNYITHLHDWYLAADAIKERQTQQQYLFLEWQKEDKNMAFLIFKNLSAIGGLIEEYERKIKKTLDENCKL